MIIRLVAVWILKSPLQIIHHIRSKEELVEPGPMPLEAMEPANDHCRPPEICEAILGDQIGMSTREKTLEVRPGLAEPLIRRVKRPSKTNIPEVEPTGWPKSLSNRWPHSPIRKEGFMELCVC